MIEHNIISSGSKGNAVVVNKDVMIDCGVPFKALQSVYRKLRLVLLTHCHCDHFNKSTIKRLAKERPSLRFGCREWMAGPLIECGVKHKNIDIFGDVEAVYHGMKVQTYQLFHDVPNCGYRIEFEDGQSLFYATDTNSLSHIEAKGCTLYMIEANYGEEEIQERIRRKEAAGEYIHEYSVLKNHLSREKAEKWIADNAGPESEYIFMHQHEERK